MQNVKLLAGVVVGTLVLVFGMAWLLSREAPAQVFDKALVEGDGRNVFRASVERVDEASESAELVGEEGSESAEVTGEVGEVGEQVVVVEFSDFQCPACRGAHPLVKTMLDRFGDQVKFVYRHFPIESAHKNAREAAIYSEYMADQGLFFAYHDLLFANQDVWAEESDPSEMFVGYGAELGVEIGEVDEKKYNERINRDMSDARALGVNSTPTFFVDGEAVGSNVLLNLVSEKIAETHE